MPEKTSQLAVIDEKTIEALDRFAEEKNLSVLTENKGQFTAALTVAAAIGELRKMLTDEVMKPIMDLQGSALGFKTDKDREGGYKVDVVREAFIEGTLKGFRFVGNQSNIIASRWYATKEGFEDFFLRLARKGEFTDFRDAYSIPKTVGEEAHVTASATWKWKGKDDKIENVVFAIRVNKGQGSDAVLGKAKRKLLARIYARVTGTVVTDGDVNDPDVINVETTPAAGEKTGAAAAAAAPEKPDAETLAALDEELKAHEPAVNAYLESVKWITKGQSFRDLSSKHAKIILGKVKDFLKAAGVEV